MIEYNKLKELLKAEVTEQTKRSLFLEQLYKEFEVYKDKQKITKRELDKIGNNLNLDRPIFKTNEYGLMHLYITKDGIKYTLYKYHFNDGEVHTEVEEILKDITREMGFDYIEKYNLELKNLRSIYTKYNRALTILSDIESETPSNDYKYFLRDSNIHHKEHSNFLQKHMKLLYKHSRE